jgi:S-formylglutathione hydrolase FrmB
MAILELRFSSRILGREVAMNAIVPDAGDGPFATFYLLHGMFDDYTGWMRRTRVEWYVRDLPLIVVMPDGQRSMYANANEGPRFHDHIVEEVIGQTERLLPAKRTRGGRAIGGLSMGGYGALRLALSHPDLFVSANSHSGALMRGTRGWTERNDPEFVRIFGRDPSGSDHDLVVLVDRCRRAGRGPKLLIDCGTEDFLLEDNREFHRGLKNWDIPHVYREHPGGHDWDYWDAHLPEAIAFHCAAMRVKKPKA